MQKLCACLGEMVAHHRGEDLGAAQPTAKADQLRELLILQLVHRPLDAALGAIQLLTDAFPSAFVSRFRDRFRMWCNGSAHPNPLGQRKHTLSDLFYCGRVLRLHRDESISDYITEKQRGPGAFARSEEHTSELQSRQYLV